jgi:hypothetical protein
MRTITEAMRHTTLQGCKYSVDSEEFQILQKIWRELLSISMMEGRK